MMTSEDGWNTHLCEVGCLMEKVKVTRHLLPDGITGQYIKVSVLCSLAVECPYCRYMVLCC